MCYTGERIESMPTDKPDKQPGETPESAMGPKKPAEPSADGKIAEPAKPAAEAAPIDLNSVEARFWDPSQIQAVVRHAGATGRSPEEFFNKKWKDRHIHGKKDEGDPQPSDGDDGAR
jgi:hypothetical protein